MNSDKELTITVRVDTEAARRAVSDFRQYALRVVEDLRAEYASLGPGMPSVAVPYSTGSDITGREVWFAAKASPADGAYAVGPVDVTAYVTDPAAGEGLISLSVSDTDVAPRRYLAEVELRGAGQVNTPLRFFLWIDPDVIR